MAEFDYEWRLRILLAERGIWSHSELIPLLAERGVRLSNTQVWRLVTGKPERLNLHTLMPALHAPRAESRDHIEQRLLQAQWPHALAKHARQRGIDLRRPIPSLRAPLGRRHPAFHLASHPFIRRNGPEG
jgi:hypothetical protein